MNLDYYYYHWGVYYKGFPGVLDGKESSCSAGDAGDTDSIPASG